MNPQVVIGANFGDEGKGLMVDYFTRNSSRPVCVVRFNGGAQAGHTVVAPDGRRHVFHHFGSGTLAGATTYLAPRFISNPMLYMKEYRELRILGVEPVVSVDPSSIVTTPYDMLLNQAAELSRETRHGSCGVGINETVVRSEAPTYRLLMRDIIGNPTRPMDRAFVHGMLDAIHKVWVPRRMEELGIRPDTYAGEFLLSYAAAAPMLNEFLENCNDMRRHVRLASFADRARERHIIFEGAQGLGLDEVHGAFPHVTRSRTGLYNVLELVRPLGLQLDVTYVTRCYVTRHGEGPLTGETAKPDWFVDTTNVPHAYQGNIRFAPITEANLNEMERRINTDLLDGGDNVKSLTLAMTCADQPPKEYLQVGEVNLDELPLRYVSYGPSADKVIDNAKHPQTVG